MGTVHLVKDRLDGLVALKRLTAQLDTVNLAAPPPAPADVATPPLRAGGGTGIVTPDGPTRVSLVGTALEIVNALQAATATTQWHVTGTGGSGERTTASGLQSAADGEREAQMAEVLRLTLAREFRLLSSLRHPNIISVLDYGFDERLEPYFTMELLERAETIMKAGRAKPLEVKLNLLAQTLQALAYLHRRGVIHRDLKPGNVMVVDGRVKVLDFGVSTLRERDTEHGKIIVGTLAYMAPELLEGAPASEASDLYAVGMIAYELFSGRYPFDMRDVVTLKNDIFDAAPDLSRLDPRVAPVVGALLEKAPSRRPASVDEVFEALSERTGQPLVVETAATRESFLQAAELVGRDDELRELTGMLDAAAAGRGRGALVGGESGVGKSRLLDELRARALVEGVTVLRGQAVSEGGGPYHVFREVLRGMVLAADVDDPEASVLQAVVPDIDALLDRAIPERPEIDPEAAQARLIAVIEGLFHRRQAPVLMILEDLHWAGSESLRLIARIARMVDELPLFMVGTYRDDERSDLPAELPGMSVLKLRRLTGEGIAALAASMLGERGRRPEVIERLLRETEGNPFFLVEVVRALAEEAGALSRVGVDTMPKTLPTGGMHRIVRKRLGHVPRRARPLLGAAAVIGRQIDLALLARIDPEADLDAWTTTCASVAVLDLHEGGFRFAHDKLREGLLSDMPTDERRDVNRRVAEAIEAEYPDAPELSAALAHHWGMAGVTEKEAHYSAIAGEQALQSSAYQEAVTFLERAITLVSAGSETAAPQRDGAITRALSALGPILPLRREAIPRGSDRFRLGHWEGRLSEAYGRLANHAEAFRRGGRALAYLGRPMPSGNAALAAGLPVQMALRGLQSRWPARFVEPSEEARTVLLEATRIHNRVTEACFYTQESLPMLWSGLSTLNLGEPAGPSASLACGYALMAAVAGVIPLNAMAEAWGRRAVELVDRVGKPYDVAFVRQRVSAYRLWMAEWKVAEAGFARVVDIANAFSDLRMLSDARMCQGMCATYQGRFSQGEELFAALNAWVSRNGDPEGMCAGRLLEATNKLRLGKLEEAMALCLAARPLADASGAGLDVLRCYGMLALSHLYLDEPWRAREMADRAHAVIQATRPVAYWTQDGIAAVAEVYLALRETSSKSPINERIELEKLTRQACKGLRAYAGVFPIGGAFALLWQGLLEHLEGDGPRAQRTWRACIVESERLGMPYEKGRAHRELGRHLPAGDPERRRHLERARAIFEELGAAFDVRRVEGEIAG
jgi:serine/threonine protein kinase